VKGGEPFRVTLGFATVFRGAEIRGNPNGVLDGVEIEHSDLQGVLNDIVGKSIRDRVGVRIQYSYRLQRPLSFKEAVRTSDASLTRDMRHIHEPLG
jgi:hypothetical protein